jgi:chromosome partitioning protein
MQTLAIANQKGGTGKTTTAVCLAAALAEGDLFSEAKPSRTDRNDTRRRVLVIDLDAQANATRWLTGRKNLPEEAADLFDVLTEEATLAEAVRPSTCDGVDLAPATPHLVGLERALASKPAPQFILEDQLDALRERGEEEGGEEGTSRETHENAAHGPYAFCLIDCPGALGTATVNALTAAGGVLVPVPAQVLSLEGLAGLSGTVETIQGRLNERLRVAGVLACRVDERTRLSQEVVEALQDRFPGELLASRIRENVRLAEAPSHGQPITEYAPRSRGAQDYRALARELVERLDPSPRAAGGPA